MKQRVANAVVIPAPWKWVARGLRLHGRGDVELLDRPLTAFFASRICPAPVIRAALDWALEQARAGATVVGGFHSPLERSVLNLLLEARGPAVVVLARDVGAARLPPAWRVAMQQGYMAVVSREIGLQRLDRGRAIGRNELAAQLAETIVVAHADANGGLAAQVRAWQRREKPLQLLHTELKRQGVGLT